VLEYDPEKWTPVFGKDHALDENWITVVGSSSSKAAALGAFAELGADSGYATIRDEIVEFKACPLGLGPLVFDGLLSATAAGVKSPTSPFEIA
jgi:hypothetical protein